MEGAIVVGFVVLLFVALAGLTLRWTRPVLRSHRNLQADKHHKPR
jgi:hypothetical protein